MISCSVMLCIFIDNIYNLCLLHLSIKMQAMRYVPLAEAISCQFAFRFIFVIGVFQIIWNMLSPNSIVFQWQEIKKLIWFWFSNHCTNIWFARKIIFDLIWLGHDFDLKSFFIYYQKIVICHSSGYYIMTLIRTSPSSCQW